MLALALLSAIDRKADGFLPPARLALQRVELGGGLFRFRVYVKRTDKTIWDRNLPYGEVAWSKDSLSVAILDADWGLTTWRSGGRVVHVHLNRPQGGLGEPPGYPGQIRWSPDNQRLMVILPSTQGEEDAGSGMLIVLVPGSRRTQVLETSHVLRADWIGNRALRYVGYELDPSKTYPPRIRNAH